MSDQNVRPLEACPRVIVLMSTYNGERYLDDQLTSIFAQQGVEVDVIVRDDGSSDETIAILDQWQSREALRWSSGENLGPAASFMQLLADAPDADFYAFADQDDYWEDDKLARAVACLGAGTDARPALYFSAKAIVDENLNALPATDPSPPWLTFGSALILSAGSGCTMVFNRALAQVVTRHRFRPLSMHDHWVYKVCTAVNGRVIYDTESAMKYRQHSRNVVSADGSLLRRAREWVRRATTGERNASREAAELLSGYADLMSADHLEVAQRLAGCGQGWRARWRVVGDHRFRTGQLLSDLAFRVAVLVGVA
jgi:rhamnosyltransferase